MSEEKKADFKVIELVLIEQTKKGDKWCGTKTDGKKLYWSKLAKDGVTERPMPPKGVKLSVLTSVVAYPGGKTMEYLNYFNEDTRTPTDERLPIPQLHKPEPMPPQPASNSHAYSDPRKVAIEEGRAQYVPPATGNPGASLKQSIPGNGSKYSDNDLKAFKSKDEAIKRGCALNNAATMVLACSNSVISEKDFSGMTLQEIVAYWKDVEKHFYYEHMAILSDKPFVETPEQAPWDHVVGEEPEEPPF